MYTVAVRHNIIIMEEITDSDSVLIYSLIIYYRAHKQSAPSKQNNKKTGVIEKDIHIYILWQEYIYNIYIFLTSSYIYNIYI